MTRPRRIQLSRKKGFRLQEHSHALNGRPAVVVSRPSRWGNPFVIGREYVRRSMAPGGGEIAGVVCDAAQAVQLFRRFTARETQLRIDAARELRGKNLACWCPLDGPCHADVLLKIANGEDAK